MKRVIFSILITTLMVLASCSRKPKVPDETLAMIFRDAYLTNAYLFSENGIKTDSLQLYQDIFDRYGYTTDEIAEAIASFSRRKSARLGDVVERAIELLESGEAYYEKESAILDTIDAIALRKFTRDYYADSLITYYDMADTVNTYLRFDSLAPGSYKLSYDYLIDTLDDNNSNYRFVTWVEGVDKSKKNHRRGVNTSYLRKKYVSSVERKIQVDTMTHELYVHLLESNERKRSPHVTIKNFKIEYTPKVEAAVDSLYQSAIDIQIFDNEFFRNESQVSYQLLPI